MKKSFLRQLLLAIVFSVVALKGFSQAAQILVDGVPVYVSSTTKFPFWLETGQSIYISTNVVSISAIEFNVANSVSGGKMLTLSSVKKINSTTGTYTVQANQTLKVEAVMLNPAVSGASNNWQIGGNAAPGSDVIGTTDNSPVTIKTGTGALGVGTDPFGKTITIGNSTAGTAVNINTGTGGYNVTTGGSSNATTTLGTSGAAVFGSSTANADKIALQPQTSSSSTSTGTITTADLTGARTWTFPDASGTLAFGTGTNTYNTYWSSGNGLAAEQYTDVIRGGLGANMTAGAIGAIPYSTSTSAYSTLADVAAGSYLRSGGVNTAPLWSSITLPNSAATAGEIWYSSGTGSMAALPRHGTNGSILMNNPAGNPAWTTLNSLPGTAGILPTANLGTGGTGSATTFLNGAGAWSTPSVTLSGGTANALTYWTSASGIGAATGSNGMYWDNGNGRLGIGNSAPGVPLHVSSSPGGWQVQFFNDNGGSPKSYAHFSHGGGYGSHIRSYTASDAIYVLELYSSTSQVAAFWASGRTTLGTAGNVGIGTTSPSEKLHVSANIKMDGNYLYTNGSSTTYGALTIQGDKNGYSGINFKHSNGSIAKTLMINSTYSGIFNPADNGWDWYFNNGTLEGGNVPIDRVSGSIPLSRVTVDAGGGYMHLGQWGGTWNTGNGVLVQGAYHWWGYYPSARDLKKNIIPVENAELKSLYNDLVNTPLYHYDYIENPKGMEINRLGMMADEVPAQMKTPGQRSINIVDGVMMSVAAIKVIKQENDELKQRVEKLEEQIQKLMKD